MNGELSEEGSLTIHFHLPFFQKGNKVHEMTINHIWRHVNWMGAMKLTKFWIPCIMHPPSTCILKMLFVVCKWIKRQCGILVNEPGFRNFFGFISIYSFWFSFLAIRFVMFNINLNKKSYVNKHNSYSNNFHYYKSQIFHPLPNVTTWFFNNKYANGHPMISFFVGIVLPIFDLKNII